MDLPSRLDTYALGRQYILSKATRLEPTMVDVEGSDVNVFCGATSVMVDSTTKQLGYCLNRTFLDGSEDEDLDRWAYDRYQQYRKGASAAVGAVLFSRATLAAGSGSIALGTTLKTLTGIEYITTSVANFGPFDYESTANVRAAQAGKTTQVGANQIQQFSQQSLLFDPSIQCTNPLPAAGGEDSEDDDTFRLRLRTFWQTARRGVLSAIVQGAVTTPGVVSATASVALTSGGLPARIVNLYISDSSGVANLQLANAVLVNLDDYRAAGIPVVIYTSIPLLVSIALALTFQAGVDTVTLAGQVKASTYEYVNSLSINQTLGISDLFTVLTRFKSAGVIVNSTSIISPVGDLVPGIGQTIRTLIQNITINGE
jgi:hypothetical protein